MAWHILRDVGLALVSLIGGTVLYGLYVILSGYFMIRNSPRENMVICKNGHGPLPQSALIDFMGEKYCSICFHNNMKAAESGKLP